MRIEPNDWRPLGVDELEDRAWQALRETERSVCVTAGAGAGKTEFLAQKAAYLLQTSLCPSPKRILAISFKRDAADTLAKRVKLRCGDDLSRRFVSMTFDAFTKSLVDQFRKTLPPKYRPPFDYDISFSTDGELNELMRGAGVTGINAAQLSKAISQVRLPIAQQDIPQEFSQALEAYWEDQFHGGAKTYLTFAMINRLAEYIVRTHGQIRTALRSTYAAVFLDEFQDTTNAQFSFLMSAFGSNGTIYTAVGDDKQRIMGWAGAMKDAFNTFETRCAAKRISLLLNWRSHDDLVTIQHLIAQELDPSVERPVARKNRSVDGNVCAIWRYNDRATELSGTAAWLANEIAQGLPPERASFLVRMKADDVEAELAPVLKGHGIVLRNLARMIGNISIQELLVEDITKAIQPFLQLGCTRRNPEAWAAAQEQIGWLHGGDGEDEIELQRTNARTEQISKAARTFMRSHSPSASTAAQLLSFLIDQIGETELRSATPAYQRQNEYRRANDGLSLLLQECAVDASNWSAVMDRFIGTGQVPLMTIHKSKGMEFHTMIFLGLDRGWWSLKPGASEELSSFFVAFTRAEQRAFFTCCQERGGQIGWLENLLGDAVERIEGPRG